MAICFMLFYVQFNNISLFATRAKNSNASKYIPASQTYKHNTCRNNNRNNIKRIENNYEDDS